MLLILILSVFILLITLSLHYSQHFRFHVSICTPKPEELELDVSMDVASPTPHNLTKPRTPQRTPRTPTPQSHTRKGGSFCCRLRPKDEGDNYDFFPTAFLYYLLFMLFLICLIIAIDIISYYSGHATLHYDILFDYSIQSYHDFEVNQRSLFAFKSIYLSNTQHPVGWVQLFLKISDYILIHSAMCLFIWESLFSFYKYYTTNVIVRKYQIVSTQAIASRFMIYAVTFAVLFAGQMHFYYYLWPLLFLLHAIFNLVCTLMFSSMLIAKYRLFIEMDGGGFQSSDDENILRSVYTMRSLSMICIVLQSIYLALFTISYTVNTIYYLPILWSINACIYSLNFVRNRKYLSFKCFQCKQKIKYNVTEPLSRQNTLTKSDGLRSKTRSRAHSHVQKAQPETHVTCTKFSVVDVKSFTIDTAIHERQSSTVSTTIIESGENHHLPHAPPQLHPQPSHQRHMAMRSVALNTKALKLLGISTIPRCANASMKNNNSNKTFIPKKTIVHSQSDIVISPTTEAAKIIPVYSKTDPCAGPPVSGVIKKTALDSIVEMCEEAPVHASYDARNRFESATDTMDYAPKLPLRRVSSPSVPREFIEQRASMNPNIMINIEGIEYIEDSEDEDEFEDDSEADSCVFIDYNPAEQLDKMDTTRVHDLVDFGTIDMEKKKVTVPKTTWLCHPQLTHRKSSSDPVGMNNSSQMNLNMCEVMESLDLFAKYGFCSRTSINSLLQIARYRKKAAFAHQITFHQSIK
eukprot:535761_1